jgi:hypothetical protein
MSQVSIIITVYYNEFRACRRVNTIFLRKNKYEVFNSLALESEAVTKFLYTALSNLEFKLKNYTEKY